MSTMGGAADGGGDHGRQFSRADIRRLQVTLANIYNNQRRAETLLEQVGFPRALVPGWPQNGTSADYWNSVFQELDRGIMDNPYQELLEIARATYGSHRELRDLYATYVAPLAEPQPPQESSPLVRWHDPRTGPAGAAQIQATAMRVLVIGASPVDPDLPPVRADWEAHTIERVAVPERVAVKVVLGAEATDVQQVGSFRPDIVHFICHGTADSLVFSDTRGESDFVKAARVAELLAFYRDTARVRLRGIVLAACNGDTLASYFGAVAETVIAHKGRLSDPCGVAFAEHLYSRLNTIPDLSGRAFAAAAREAAQLTAQYSAACEPVIANLITVSGG
jgi:effector-associated domain 1 (EAD1)-containing protein/CHAT domain-containing protein